jgi:CheY-like chemotaxis protein
MLLEGQGYEVVSSLGFTESLKCYKRGKFDLFILGHSVPQADKEELVAAFRKQNPAPIVSLRQSAGDQLVDGADFHTEADHEPLLHLVAQIISGRV